MFFEVCRTSFRRRHSASSWTVVLDFPALLQIVQFFLNHRHTLPRCGQRQCSGDAAQAEVFRERVFQIMFVVTQRAGISASLPVGSTSVPVACFESGVSERKQRPGKLHPLGNYAGEGVLEAGVG